MSNWIAVSNVSSGVFEQRKMTAKEIEADELNRSEASKIEAEAAVKETARQALLDKLGITADEAKLLLG